ncbi:MAG: hypothetical protein MRY79_05600 [Alphaproteobacteria bacterium]|nr:hypothetical protein [Alphaproteobacteria bacterium]
MIKIKDALDRAKSLNGHLDKYEQAQKGQSALGACLQDAWVEYCADFFPVDMSPGMSDRFFARGRAEFALRIVCDDIEFKSDSSGNVIKARRTPLRDLDDDNWTIANVLQRAKDKGFKLNRDQRRYLQELSI